MQNKTMDEGRSIQDLREKLADVGDSAASHLCFWNVNGVCIQPGNVCLFINQVSRHSAQSGKFAPVKTCLISVYITWHAAIVCGMLL